MDDEEHEAWGYPDDRSHLWPNAAALRAVADVAAKEAGLGPDLSGPYRWRAPGAPRVNGYLDLDTLPPAHHLAFYLGLPPDCRDLISSTAILIDERGPTVIWVGCAMDEG